MIKVKNNIATREPLPSFLIGLAPESLADLSWTDPELGVSDAAWWPEVDQSSELGEYQRYGTETLTVDAENQRVIVVRSVEPWSAEEIAQAKAESASALIASFDSALTEHLDSVAKEKRYDNRITCALRAGYQGPFQAEGQAFASWMDTCNALAYQIMSDVQSGKRQPPDSVAAFLAEFPQMVWS